METLKVPITRFLKGMVEANIIAKCDALMHRVAVIIERQICFRYFCEL